LIALLIPAALFGAEQEATRFEIVHIGPSKTVTPGVDVINLDCGARCTGSAGELGQGRALFNGATMLRIIAAAYGVNVTSVFGGPSWLATSRFDIYAKTATATSPETLKTMFQGLLSEQFSLAVHWEDRPIPAYVLETGTGKPRLQQSLESVPPTCKTTNSAGMISLACEHQSMTGLASDLSRGYMPETVTDATGLKGAYDFTLNFRPVGSLIRAASDARFDPSSDISVFDAVAKLGLKLERRLQPARVVVIDRVDEKPVGGVGSAPGLPAVPAEFEVADIRPMQPGAPYQPDRYLPGGQVEMHGWTANRLIKLAYNLDDDEIVGAPKWFSSDRFDIVAKTSLTRDDLQVARAANGMTNRPPMMYAEMLQKLLAQTFKLAVHSEVRPIPVYVLTVADRGVRLKESSPSSRTLCTDTTDVGGLETYTCQNITLAQFAPNLHATAPFYFVHPMVDLTGLKGAYDLTLKWHWAVLINTPGNRGAPPDSTIPEGRTPDGYISMFEALEKQLGLKAVLQKHPMPVLVIDHIERAPQSQ
jgi:uncharacterized protein (TIGR03435 family)